jgi:hypothetical protein
MVPNEWLCSMRCWANFDVWLFFLNVSSRIVLIVPRHTKNRTEKHTLNIYSNGIDLQQAQEP